MDITHKFVSPVADDPTSPQEVRPSNWNDGHALMGGIVGNVLTVGQNNTFSQTSLSLVNLTDVLIASPSDGQVLVFNSGTGKWENDQRIIGKNAASGSNLSGSEVLLQSGNGDGSGSGGNVVVNAGAAGTTSNGNGGNFELAAGGGHGFGTGGEVSLLAGDGGISGNGGPAILTAGSAQFGGSGMGGNVTISAGIGEGGGDGGSVVLIMGIGAANGKLILENATMTAAPGASAGTLTDAPAAGNPQGYLTVRINGVIWYLPAWHV